MVFSPDSAWLAWSHEYRSALRSIRLADLASGEVHDVTGERFVDTDPTFTLDGKHLAFLSARTFDPVYDAHTFDLSFTVGVRPYLIPLALDTPSPFDPEVDGRAPEPNPASRPTPTVRAVPTARRWRCGSISTAWPSGPLWCRCRSACSVSCEPSTAGCCG